MKCWKRWDSGICLPEQCPAWSLSPDNLLLIVLWVKMWYNTLSYRMCLFVKARYKCSVVLHCVLIHFLPLTEPLLTGLKGPLNARTVDSALAMYTLWKRQNRNHSIGHSTDQSRGFKHEIYSHLCSSSNNTEQNCQSFTNQSSVSPLLEQLKHRIGRLFRLLRWPSGRCRPLLFRFNRLNHRSFPFLLHSLFPLFHFPRLSLPLHSMSRLKVDLYRLHKLQTTQLHLLSNRMCHQCGWPLFHS